MSSEQKNIQQFDKKNEHITDYKKSGEGTRTRYLNISNIFESLSEGFFSLDSKWCFAHVNKYTASYLGFDVKELVGQNIWEKFLDTANKDFETACLRAINSQKLQYLNVIGTITALSFYIGIYPSSDGVLVYWQNNTDQNNTEIAPGKEKDESKNHFQNQPEIPADIVTEGYTTRFRIGANVSPRVLFIVRKLETGTLGINPKESLIESRRSTQEKSPWKEVASLKSMIESKFLHKLYQGESIAPFRILETNLAIIPWDDVNNSLINSNEAKAKGYYHLGDWLTKAEKLWIEKTNGTRSLYEQLDYQGHLSEQFPIASLKVVYSNIVTLPTASLLEDTQGIIGHNLYWTEVKTKTEGFYLIGILNSKYSRKIMQNFQSLGQRRAGNFNKFMVSSIPQFDPRNKLHVQIAILAIHAQELAEEVDLIEKLNFIQARQKVMDALDNKGISDKIDNLVDELLISK